MSLKKVYTKNDVLKKPLSFKQMQIENDQGKPVSGVIAVRLLDIVAGDAEEFIDLISDKLTGSDLLTNIDYEVVGHEGNTLWLEVTGDASEIVAFEQ